MNLLAPGMLLLGLLAAPIILLYLLRLRRRDAVVSSTLLWEQILRDRQASAPWQRLKQNIFLLLQLLILAALILALARPAVPAAGIAVDRIVLVLDGSASMRAADVQPNRFEAARRAAVELVQALPSGASITVILAAAQPQLLVAAEQNKGTVQAALETVQPGYGEADWAAALALASGSLSAGSDQEPAVVILSDGGLPEAGLPPLPGDIRYIAVGQAGSNLGIAALALRQSGSAEPELFASVINNTQEDTSAILSFYQDDQLFESRRVSLPAGESQAVVLTGLNVTGSSNAGIRYTARLSSAAGSQSLDDLALDDSAFAVYTPSGDGRTLLVSEGNLFLRRLLESLPGIEAFAALPGPNGEVQIPVEDYDIYILDGVFPAQLPEGNLLLINPPDNPIFGVTEPHQQTGPARVTGHPLARSVDWNNVHIRSAKSVQLPAWAEEVVTAPGGPLVFAGELGSRRIAVVTFDLHDSDLPLQVAFPVLFSNLLGYLGGQQVLTVLSSEAGSSPVSGETALQGSSGIQASAGQSILIRPAAEAETARVTAPDGQLTNLVIAENGAIFSAIDQPGFYTVDFPGHPELGQQVFAVNLFSPLESDITPRDSLQVGRESIRRAAADRGGQRELWPWLAALGLLLLLLEWGLYYRRQGQRLDVRRLAGWLKPRRGMKAG